MQIKDVIRHLESIAPPSLQEGYDNAGLIVGDPQANVQGVLTCLDSTEAIVEEAIEKGCNLVVAHHPIVFKGLKRLTGKNYVERTVIKAIKNDIAIYAIHTNLDHVRHRGVNERIALQLGLEDIRILAQKKDALLRFEAQVEVQQIDTIKAKLQDLLQGQVSPSPSYLFGTVGVLQHENGTAGAGVLSFVAPHYSRRSIENLLAKQLPADTYQLQVQNSQNTFAEVGAGMIGKLSAPMPIHDFLKKTKDAMQAGVVRYTAPVQKEVQTIAVCGGAGGFLLPAAKGAGADVFVTSDYKYHEFFDADGDIVIADIGHFESEQYTIELLQEIISQKFSNFAVHCTSVNTNPVHYL